MNLAAAQVCGQMARGRLKRVGSSAVASEETSAIVPFSQPRTSEHLVSLSDRLEVLAFLAITTSLIRVKLFRKAEERSLEVSDAGILTDPKGRVVVFGDVEPA